MKFGEGRLTNMSKKLRVNIYTTKEFNVTTTYLTEVIVSNDEGGAWRIVAVRDLNKEDSEQTVKNWLEDNKNRIESIEWRQ